MRLYIAGPITGIPQFNFPAFDNMAALLRRDGYEVVSPAEMDDLEGFREIAMASPDGKLGQQFNGQTWGDFLARDVKLIADGGITAVVVLPGWAGSRGALLETFVASLSGILVVRPVIVTPDQPVQLYVVMRDELAIRVGAMRYADLHDTEVRKTDHATGGQKGAKLTQIGALDPVALIILGRVAGVGAIKYAAFNFLKGYDWDLSFNAAMRHAMLFWAGEDIDACTAEGHPTEPHDYAEGCNGTGQPHSAMAAWHLLTLTSFQARGIGNDVRPPRLEPVAERALSAVEIEHFLARDFYEQAIKGLGLQISNESKL